MAGSAGGSAAAVVTAEGPSRGGGLVTTSEAGLAVVCFPIGIVLKIPGMPLPVDDRVEVVKQDFIHVLVFLLTALEEFVRVDDGLGESEESGVILELDDAGRHEVRACELLVEAGVEQVDV